MHYQRPDWTVYLLPFLSVYLLPFLSIMIWSFHMQNYDLQCCYNNIWFILFLTNNILEFLDLYCMFQFLQVPSKQTLMMENI